MLLQPIVPTVILGEFVNPLAVVAVAALPANVDALVMPVIPEYATFVAVAALPVVF
jgi:hypothetical protein